jgi:SsrA-binding protein
MSPAAPSNGTKPVASNRRARHDYEILDVVEAGIALVGTEVKSLRDGKIQLKDSYARIEDGELWLVGVHVAPYEQADGFGGHDPERRRKLLLHRDEIDEFGSRSQRESLSIVPLSVYFKNGKVKVELALARGRKQHDKRAAMATADANRDMARAMNTRGGGEREGRGVRGRPKDEASD